jgi:hypothetical protein
MCEQDKSSDIPSFELPSFKNGCLQLLLLHLVSVYCSFTPKVDCVDVADPVVIGHNTAAIRARVVQKTGLPDRSSVPMATNAANIGLGWGWSG